MSGLHSMGALASSKTGVWMTPRWLFRQLDAEFSFTVDVCATAENAQMGRFFSPEQDGIAQSWAGERCWMNPPYGKEMPRWLAKAVDEVRHGCPLVVGLIPARTGTSWWHQYVEGKALVRFLQGRLKFGDSTNSAPFDSAVVVWMATDLATSADADPQEEGAA